MRALLCCLISVLAVTTLCGCRSTTPYVAMEGPSNDRNWEPSMSVLAHADVEDDNVTLHNVRRCSYVSEDIYTTDFRDRAFKIDDVQTVDFIVVPFKGFPSLAHTMLSFGLSDGSQIGVSVEARLEKNETYSPTMGALQQYELMYVVADEHDLITLRTEHRDTDVYVYRARATQGQVQRLFLDVVERVNKLRAAPEYYNTLTNNCTTNLVGHVNALNPGAVPYGIQVLLPGHSDRLAYDLELIDTTVPFDVLKRDALVTERANAAAGMAEFSQLIRR